MADDALSRRVQHPLLRTLGRKTVLAGLMFVAISAFGLWLSREYPIGTAVRMGTGYMPRLLCWMLMGLGAIITIHGFLERDGAAADAVLREEEGAASWWPILFVSASLVAFGLTIERFGLVVAVVLLVVLASLAYRGLRWWETALAAVFLTGLSWAVFILGLGMSVPVLPEFGY